MFHHIYLVTTDGKIFERYGDGDLKPVLGDRAAQILADARAAERQRALTATK